MAGADGIYVVLLHQSQIQLHLLNADDRASHRIGIMAVDAPEFYGSAVDVHYIILNVNFPDANAVRNDFPLRFPHHGVQIRVLGVPWHRVFYPENPTLRKCRVVGCRSDFLCRQAIFPIIQE